MQLTYVTFKVWVWCDEVKPAKITDIYLHAAAAYSAFTHDLFGACHRLCILDIQKFLQPLTNVIYHHLIPALFGCPSCSSVEKDLYTLPVRLGGLGLENSCNASHSQFL